MQSHCASALTAGCRRQVLVVVAAAVHHRLVLRVAVAVVARPRLAPVGAVPVAGVPAAVAAAARPHQAPVVAAVRGPLVAAVVPVRLAPG